MGSRDGPAIWFLGEDHGHSNTAGIWFVRNFVCFPSESGHYGFASDELDIFDFPERFSPPLRGEDVFCSFMDGGGTNPKPALRIYKLAVGSEHPGKVRGLAFAPCIGELPHGENFFRNLLLRFDGRAREIFAERRER